MRVRTLEAYWLLKKGLLNSYPSLQSAEQAQVAVIGGGITGALVSYALTEQGYDVILLDKRDIGTGSTAATTSMLQYEIDVPLYRLAEQIGEQGAVACYKAGIDAIGKLEQLILTKDLDAGFERKHSLYIAKSNRHLSWLKKEYEIRNRHRLGVAWLSGEQVEEQYGINCYGAILSEHAASIDAYRLAHQLIAISAKKGMKVYDQTEISRFEWKSDSVIIHTPDKCKVTCDKVLFCNGYEATQLVKEKICRLFYTYACVSEQNTGYKKILDTILVWDTGSPYSYMRTTDDHRLLIGGADSQFNWQIFQNALKEIRTNRLMRRLQELLPGNTFVEDFSWGGTFGSTKDGLPYIGISPEYKNAMFALGYGGNGIVFSVQAMEIITDLLRGKEHPLSHWYRFKR